MPAIPDALLRWAAPPRRVRYARVGRAGDIELHRVLVEESWGELEESEGGVFVRRTARDVTGEPKIIEDARVGFTAEGFVDVGLYGRDGALSLWSPPQVVLPPQPSEGATWTATHTRGTATSEREVSVQACTDHGACLVSVAEVKRPGGVLVLRMHFAEGDGFVGYEALVLSEGGPPVRMWTESVTVTRR